MMILRKNDNFATKFLSILIKSVLTLFLFTLSFNGLYASSCKLVKSKADFTGEVTFKCDKDTDLSLADNKLSFEIKSNNSSSPVTGVSNLYTDKAYTSYKIEEISKGVFKVEFNAYDTWTENNPYIAEEDKDIKFEFDVKDKSSKDYEIISDEDEANPFEVVQNNKDAYENNGSNTNLLLRSGSDEPVADDNAIILYIDSKIDKKGKPVVKKISDLWVDGFDAKYSVEDVSDTRKKVTIELYKWWPKNQPATIADGNTVQIGISYHFNSWPHEYKVSLHKEEKPIEDETDEDKVDENLVNKYQFYRGLGSLIYAATDSLYCTDDEKCDDAKLSIAKGCKEFDSCDAISELNTLRLGIVGEKEA